MTKPSKHDLAEVVMSLSKKMPLNKLSKSLASYLQQENRTGELDAIMREVKFLRQKQDGIIEADVTSAFPISNTTKKNIVDIFGSKTLINQEIDKDVIGGVRVETNEHLLDLTVRNRLNQLKSIRGVEN